MASGGGIEGSILSGIESRSRPGAAMSLNSQLSGSTGFFGLRLWVVIGIGLGVFTILILFLLTVWLASSRRRSRNAYEKFPSFCSGGASGVVGGSSSSCTTSAAPRIPAVSKEIKEVVVPTSASSPAEGVLLTISDKDTSKPDNKVYVHVGFNRRGGAPAVGVEMGSAAGRRRVARTDIEASPGSNALEIVPAGGVYPEDAVSSDGGGGVGRRRSQRYSDGSCLDVVLAAPAAATPNRGELGWGYWFTLRDLEAATGGFVPDNVLGEGGYGIVYRGCLVDGTQIAVKSLLNNRGQAEREFRVEVEAIGRVRHKNLVRLLGYCVEGNYRMLVYEYVDNGNLEQWLHGPASILNSPTWEVRMKIALGTAKALAYLHEALEPKVVHRDIKASNILLDAHWNAKISDFGLAKMLGSENSHIKTRVMGTFGYVAPEYANTGLLNERSDVYSFGVLLMEIITGRDPVDYGRPAGEVNLVDWLKHMVACRRSEEVADDRLDSRPSGRALKRALLVALRCVDPEAGKRPRMGQVVHLLENDELTSREDSRSSREPTSRRPTSEISNEDVASVSESF